MSSRNTSWPLCPEEIARAVTHLAHCLEELGVRYSICGGAAALLHRMRYNLPQRLTRDIDLVVQLTEDVTAESVSARLAQIYTHDFVLETTYGIPILVMSCPSENGTMNRIEIEILDVQVWPERTQYNLNDTENEVVQVPVFGVQVSVFSPRWLVRDKVVTAFQRQGNQKSKSDLEDALILLPFVEIHGIDLTNHEDAVQYVLDQKADFRSLLESRIVCPSVFGSRT